MTLHERLTADLKGAMKSGDKQRTSTLRMIKAAIKNAEIDQGKPLDDAGVVEIFRLSLRQIVRFDAIEYWKFRQAHFGQSGGN